MHPVTDTAPGPGSVELPVDPLDERFEVARILDLADGVREFWLRPVDAKRLPLPTPGMHLIVRLPSGLRRNYSLVNGPSTREHFAIAVKLESDGRGGSREMFELAEHSVIDVVGYDNTFPVDDSDREHVFIAGGIGITPIWSMIQHAETRGTPWRLYYGARSRLGAAYLDELETLEAAQPGRVTLAFSEDGDRLPVPEILGDIDDGSGVYCCGPERVTTAFREHARALGARAHLEDFAVAEAADGGFEVTLARSDTTLSIPEGATILDVVLEAGIEPEYSCMSGTCGSCEVAVLSGIPEHRDFFLTDEEKAENTRMMICCSGRRSGRLVIDL